MTLFKEIIDPESDLPPEIISIIDKVAEGSWLSGFDTASSFWSESLAEISRLPGFERLEGIIPLIQGESEVVRERILKKTWSNVDE